MVGATLPSKLLTRLIKGLKVYSSLVMFSCPFTTPFLTAKMIELVLLQQFILHVKNSITGITLMKLTTSTKYAEATNNYNSNMKYVLD